MLDPTLLVNKEEYDAFLPKDRLVSTKYVLLYCVSFDRTFYNYVKKVCQDEHLVIVTIKCCSTKDSFDSDDLNYDNASVQDWLSLISNAEMVFSNSYHATIFSVIYKKCFYVKPNSFGSSKIVQLLEELGLCNRIIDCNKPLPDKTIDFSNVMQKIHVLQKSSIVFLKESLNVQ